MARALQLAARGEGFVEPNPMVGCVIVRDGEIVGEGHHERFGGPHAEINALTVAGERAAGATAYVTLEPCCHHGKTPPCTAALAKAGIRCVVAAVTDPFPEVDGGGIAALQSMGIECRVGVQAAPAEWLLAPYRMRLTSGRPWIVAKWAMTLDGKIATRAGNSQWISSEASRALVHQLRGRMDAIMVGSGTARADDPLLTARPVNLADVKRTATRIVVDSAASLSPDSKLVQTARDIPLLVAVGTDASLEACNKLRSAGAEVIAGKDNAHDERLASLFSILAERRMTNILVEGGSRLIGTLFENQMIDEVHVFVAPKIVGGAAAVSPIGGLGVERMAEALKLADISIEELEGDVYIHGRVAR